MYFTAPSSARQGDRVLITVNRLPNGTESVKFIASGNSGIDITAASGGSANFMISLDLPGTTTIEAIAQDKYGATLTGVSPSISVTDKSFQAAGTFPPQRRFGMGGSLSGIYEAVIGTMTDIYAQGHGEAEQIEFSASNAEMGWMMAIHILPRRLHQRVRPAELGRHGNDLRQVHGQARQRPRPGFPRDPGDGRSGQKAREHRPRRHD